MTGYRTAAGQLESFLCVTRRVFQAALQSYAAVRVCLSKASQVACLFCTMVDTRGRRPQQEQSGAFLAALCVGRHSHRLTRMWWFHPVAYHQQGCAWAGFMCARSCSRLGVRCPLLSCGASGMLHGGCHPQATVQSAYDAPTSLCLSLNPNARQCSIQGCCSC
jgi:hypothetical protein